MKYLVLVKRGSRISKIKWNNSAETALSKYYRWPILGILPKWYFFSFQTRYLHVILMMSKLFHRVDKIVEVNQHYAYHNHSWRTIYFNSSESTINKTFNYIKFYFLSFIYNFHPCWLFLCEDSTQKIDNDLKCKLLILLWFEKIYLNCVTRNWKFFSLKINCLPLNWDMYNIGITIHQLPFNIIFNISCCKRI